jgi:hypothetical protein
MLQNKNFVMQGGVRNYLGKTEEVKKAPKYWQSSPDSPKTELSYITDAEKELILKANLHGSLINQQPNVGASGILSFDGWGDASDGFGSSSYSSDSGSTGSYDEAGISTPTSAYDSIGSTDSGDGNGYSGPTYDEAGTTITTAQLNNTGPTDPGLAGSEAVTWNVDKQGNLTVKSTPDSITDYGQNLQSEIQSQIKQSGIKGLTNKLGWAVNPVGKAIGTAVGVGAQTLAANYLLGNIANPFSTWTSPAGDWFAKNTTQAKNTPQASAYTQDSGGGDSSSGQQQAAAPTQTISGVEIESPAQKFYNQQQQTGQLSFQSDYDAAKQKINGLLGSPSSLGLLAVNDSPFYDFLKSINLNRRII